MKSSSYRVVMITAMVLCVVVVGYYMATSGGVGAAPVIAQVGPDTPAGPSAGTPATTPSGGSSLPPGSAIGGPVTTGPSSRPAGSDPMTGGGSVDSGRGGVPRSPWDEPPKPADTVRETASDAPKTHTVKAGDTFQSIAKQYLGSENKWKDIAEANPKVDPTRLKIGQVLRVPEGKGAAKPAPADRGASSTTDHGASPATGEHAATGGGKSHKIKQGDTLSSISKQYYGTTAHWKLIYTANKSKIGDDPDRLPDGIELTIPPAPAKKSN